MTIEVEGPNGIVVEFPDGTSRKTIQTAMAKKFGGPKGKGKPAPKQEEPGYFESAFSGLRSGLESATQYLPNVNEMIAKATMSPEKWNKIQAGRKQLDTRSKQAAQAHPYVHGAGDIAGQVIGTAPAIALGSAGLGALGTELAAVAPRTGNAIANIARATRTGGMGVRGVSKEAVRRGSIVAATKPARVGLRLAGGALAGAANAALTGQDATTGAMIGGGIPVVGGLLGKTFGAGYDVLARRVGKTRAAEMLRKAVGNNLERVQSALASATDDEKRSLLQFLEDKGIQIPQLAAIEKNVAQSGQAQPLREAAQRTNEELANLRANVRRGGQTATEAEQIINQDRRDLMQATEAQRQAGLTAMDVGRTQVLPLEAQAQQFGEEAAQNVQNVRRFAPAEQRFAGASDTGSLEESLANIDFLRTPEQLRMGQLATRAGNFATDQAEASLAAGQASREAQMSADMLRAEGAKPVNINPIVANLRKDASDAQFVDQDQADILNDLANNLEARAAKFGGVIDANGFYGIRKNVNKTIDRLLAGRPQAAKQYTSQLMGGVREKIDAAIRAAGGDELLQSINTVATGLKDLEQQGVAAKLARIQQKHPERFARIMAGDEPGIVRQLTDHETGDITEALGSRIVDVQKLAGVSNPGVMRGKFYIPDETPGAVDLRRGVASEAADIMAPGVPIWARATGQLMAAKVPGGGRAGAVLEGSFGEKMKAKVLNQLAPALANPKNAAALMGEIPTSEVLANYIAGLSPQARNRMAQSLITGGLYSQKPNY